MTIFMKWAKVAADVADLAKQMEESLNQRPDVLKLQQAAEAGDLDAKRLWDSIRSALRQMRVSYPGAYKLMPWAVKQLKGMTRNYQYDIPYAHVVDIAGGAGELLNEMRQQNRVPAGFDVNRMDFSQVEEWLYEQNRQKSMGDLGGTVVFQLGNGWTIRQLTTDAELAAEGEVMGHCVGSYCRRVQIGKSLIYSLRDPKNEPHATIEIAGNVVEQDAMGYDVHAEPLSPQESSWQVVQIQGKSNDEPIPEYQAMIKEWIDSLKQQGLKLGWEGETQDPYDSIDGPDDLLEWYEKEHGRQTDEDAYGLPVDVAPYVNWDRLNGSIVRNMLSSEMRHTDWKALAQAYYMLSSVSDTHKTHLDRGIPGNDMTSTFKQNVQELEKIVQDETMDFMDHMSDYAYQALGPMPDDPEGEEEWYKQEQELMDEWEDERGLTDLRRFVNYLENLAGIQHPEPGLPSLQHVPPEPDKWGNIEKPDDSMEMPGAIAAVESESRNGIQYIVSNDGSVQLEISRYNSYEDYLSESGDKDYAAKYVTGPLLFPDSGGPIIYVDWIGQGSQTRSWPAAGRATPAGILDLVNWLKEQGLPIYADIVNGKLFQKALRLVREGTVYHVAPRSERDNIKMYGIEWAHPETLFNTYEDADQYLQQSIGDGNNLDNESQGDYMRPSPFDVWHVDVDDESPYDVDWSSYPINSDQLTLIEPDTDGEGMKTAAPRVMYHVAPHSARGSILQRGIDWRRGDPRLDWREDGDEELYPYANYLTTSLDKAKEYQNAINGGGHIYKVDASGLNLVPDLDEDYEGTSFYTTKPIGPERLRLLNDQGAE
jgi:hypothetical protein